jgi:hypothetical protein
VRALSSRALPWALAAAGAALPLLAGPSLAHGLRHLDAPVRATASVGLWVGWAVALLAALVPHPVALTALRVLAPAGAVVCVGVRGSAPEATVAAVAGVAVAALAMAPAVGLRAVNGLAYPNERRFPLRAPGAVLAGPIVLAWAFAVGGFVAGPLLLAASEWVAGAVATVSGVPLALLLVRALHGLSRRWLVFVPAGVVVHDLVALTDPVLLRRTVIASLGPAPVGTDAVDLTQRAPGLALEVALTEPVELQLPGRRGPQKVEASAALVTPTRPGAVLAEADRRRINTA